jgi:hypothetical protein
MPLPCCPPPSLINTLNPAQAIRRRRYRVVLDWGRWLYRCCAVSYSALQLYEHPWLVRAVVSAIWTSSKLAMGILV